VYVSLAPQTISVEAETTFQAPAPPSEGFWLRLQKWRREVRWCPGRLLDIMPPNQMFVLSSGVWWSLLLDIRWLWRP